MTPSPQALMTIQGTLLCRAPDGGIVQRELPEAGGGFLAAEGLGAVSGAAGTAELLSFSRQGRFLRACPDRRTVAFDRDTAREHERFLPLTEADRQLLLGLLTRDWLLRSTGELIAAGTARLAAPFSLHLGPHRFDLREQLPFLGPALPHRVSLLHDGWRPDELNLLRPLVLFVAFRSPAVFAQLAAALRSLITHGGYRGEIAVLTDRPRDDILALVPELEPARLRTETIAAADRVGCIAARYALLDLPGLQRYQPVLYADTDIVFDAPVEPLLRAAALAGAICAPLETHGTLAGSGPVGAELLDADPDAPDSGSAPGFNAGTLAIPNLATHGDALRLIRRAVVNRSDVFGRAHFAWVDQPVANYVGWRRGGIETRTLTPSMRWGVADLPAEAPARCGMVHFWVDRGAEQKARAMGDYLDRIAASDADVHTV